MPLLQLTNDVFHQGVTKERTLVPAWTNQKNLDFLLIHWKYWGLNSYLHMPLNTEPLIFKIRQANSVGTPVI